MQHTIVRSLTDSFRNYLVFLICPVIFLPSWVYFRPYIFLQPRVSHTIRYISNSFCLFSVIIKEKTKNRAGITKTILKVQRQDKTWNRRGRISLMKGGLDQVKNVEYLLLRVKQMS